MKDLAANKEIKTELSPRDREAIHEKTLNKTHSKSSGLIINENKIVKRDASSKSYRSSYLENKRQNNSYKKTMAQIQKEMPVLNRLFSKFIHNNVNENIFDALAATLFRPSSLLFGFATSLIIGSFFYYFAKRYGYIMSGSEPIVAFACGWLIGLLYDLIKAVFDK